MPDKKKSKFFRVAIEGATTDGRKIEKKWLQEIAATYNQAKYSARIFIEHIRGFHPNATPGFRCMGDVVAVKTEENADGKLELHAQIDPTDEMVQMVGNRQKIYSSIEVQENFAGTGMAYLVGMGITDSPASLGTEVLQFAAQNPAASPFASRKHSPDNLISVGEESEIEFEDVETPSPSLLDRVKQLFSAKGRTDDQRFNDVHSAVVEIATVAAGQGEKQADIGARLGALETQFAELKTGAADTAQLVAGLQTKIDHTPNSDPARPPATGGGNGGANVTDC